jgi:hypothetical protein
VGDNLVLGGDNLGIGSLKELKIKGRGEEKSACSKNDCLTSRKIFFEEVFNLQMGAALYTIKTVGLIRSRFR